MGTDAIALARRIATEKRTAVVPLAVALLANLALYALAVYPLTLKATSVERRAAAGERELGAAERDHAAARAILTGKDQAARELDTFYREVLPVDLTGARRLTYLRLAQLARQASLRYERRSVEREDSKDGRLTRLRIAMVLEGDYANVRQFIYQLETAPEFVVIDDVALAEGADATSPLLLTLELSTYFKPPDGS